MDNFENASPPQIMEEKINAKCWECEQILLCNEFVVCCTGTMFHYCDTCLDKLRDKK